MNRFLAVFLSLVVCAAGQQELPAVEDEVRVGVTATRRLTLEEALQAALENNLEIEVERTAVLTARQALRGAKGAFDSILRYTPGLETRATPQANTLFAADGKLSERFLNNNFSFRQATPLSGLSFNVDFLNGRNNTNNPFSALNPFFQSSLNLGFSLPLLRNRELDFQRAEIRIRQKNLERSTLDFETRVIDVMARTIEAYWEVVSALEAARVARDGVNLAREQLDRSRRQVDAGTLAPVELSASEAELQRRRDSYVAAVGAITIAENALKQLMAPNRENALWGERILPVSAPAADAATPALPESVSSALARRPELRSLELSAEAAKVQTKLAKTQTKPQVNLVGGYSLFGLAGTQVIQTGGFGQVFQTFGTRLNELSAIAGLPLLPPVNAGGGVPPNFIGGYGQDLSNLFGGTFKSVQAGVQIEWNPRNNAAEAQLAQAQLQERRLEISRRQLEQVIEAQVRATIQGIFTAHQRIEAARASEKAAREKLDSEVRLFQTGESTNFLVLTRQNELLDSRRRVVDALLLLNRTLTRYDQAVGGLLEKNGIRIDPVH
jgi:HAE1 family hydrophobic/amphiphilic exporter-1